jgi:hypothetical protein
MRKPSLSLRTKLKILAGLVVVALITFVLANLRPAPIRIQISFMGFTNLSSTYTTRNGSYPVTYALLCVSNVGNCSVYELARYGCEITNDPGSGIPYGGDSGLISGLKPGEFKTVSIEAPWENRQPWRAVLVFCKPGWGYKLLQQPTWVQNLFGRILPERLRPEVHEEKFHSEWLPSPEIVPRNLLHAVRADDLSPSEKDELAKKLREKFRPAMERWAKAYGSRLPIAPDDVTLDRFSDRLGDDLYTFVLGDFTLTFDESKDSTKVSYLASRKALIQLNKSPTGEAPKTDLPVTREEIARMVQADTGVSFKPNEILMTPTGIGFAMNGGANIRIGPPKIALPAVSGPDKLDIVVGPDGKLAYYMRDPFF